MTYSGKTKAALNQIKSMLDAIAGTQATYKGIPLSIAARVTASVAVGDRLPRDKAAGYHESDVNFFVAFSYRVVDNSYGAAEDTVADWLDDFTDAWLADRTLNGTVRNSALDFALAREPQYRPVSGAEFRDYVLVVQTTISR